MSSDGSEVGDAKIQEIFLKNASLASRFSKPFCWRFRIQKHFLPQKINFGALNERNRAVFSLFAIRQGNRRQGEEAESGSRRAFVELSRAPEVHIVQELLVGHTPTVWILFVAREGRKTGNPPRQGTLTISNLTFGCASIKRIARRMPCPRFLLWCGSWVTTLEGLYTEYDQPPNKVASATE